MIVLLNSGPSDAREEAVELIEEFDRHHLSIDTLLLICSQRVVIRFQEFQFGPEVSFI